jgi:hypothetical protein
MKKIMLLGVVIATTLVACKKESTSPNTNNTIEINSFDGKKVVMVVGDDGITVDTIEYIYDSNSQIIKTIFYNHGSTSDIREYNWNGNSIIIDTNDLKIKFNSDGMVLKQGNINLFYENGYLIKYGLNKGQKLIESNDVVAQDTFVSLKWQNGNLISDYYYTYEYYLDTLNYGLSYFGLPGPGFVFPSSDYSLNFLPGGEYFYRNLYGYQSKNLLKKVIQTNGMISEFSYTLDSKNGIINVKIHNYNIPLDLKSHYSEFVNVKIILK